MHKFILPFAASIAVASPALANEARVEARAAVVFTTGEAQDSYGIAAGYDIDLGKQGFVGVEVSGDKIANPGTKVALGFTGRAGYKAETGTRLFVAGGYTTTTCDGCVGAVHAGAGFEQNIGSNAYGKLEYRHYFVGDGFNDYNGIAVGVGFRF